MYVQKKAQLMVERLKRKGITDTAVLDAMSKVPRHLFISGAFEQQAYDEKALPIGFGQTISHPYTVARMTELLEVKAGKKILEIGTGSGYQAAILSAIGASVFSVEVNKKLSEKANDLLNSLGFKVALKVGDGSLGWQTYSPYDAIIVTAGAPKIPEILFKQLENGGILLIPVGSENKHKLYICRKEQEDISVHMLEEFRFVPLHTYENSDHSNEV